MLVKGPMDGNTKLQTLKGSCFHFDEIIVSGCSDKKTTCGAARNENFLKMVTIRCGPGVYNLLILLFKQITAHISMITNNITSMILVAVSSVQTLIACLSKPFK